MKHDNLFNAYNAIPTVAGLCDCTIFYDVYLVLIDSAWWAVQIILSFAIGELHEEFVEAGVLGTEGDRGLFYGSHTILGAIVNFNFPTILFSFCTAHFDFKFTLKIIVFARQSIDARHRHFSARHRKIRVGDSFFFCKSMTVRDCTTTLWVVGDFM